ncbi:hypothetical protein [Nocardioides sp.]|uniref:hypothetical protein n=1 Tax=Nocardioides sp. TaxID=35761 RepID=UPI002B26F2E8|nr:hypothetical protein [Nocardioides sp.]
MRLNLRRGGSAHDSEKHDGTGGPSGPPAAFATLIEGRWLWVAVDAQPGRLALARVDADSQVEQVVDVPTEAITDQPDHLGARLDLAALDGHEQRYDVVVVPPDGGTPLSLTTEPLPSALGHTSIDGRTQHLLVRAPDGRLRVRTTLLPEAAGLLGVRKLPDALEVTLLDAGAGADLAILDDEGAVLASWPIDERGTATITPRTVTHLEPTTRPAVTGHAGAWKPVRRRANDLLDPRSAAPLPQLDQPHADRPLLRLPWSREAALLVRIFADDEAP